MELKKHINFIINAHNNQAKTPEKQVRLWDKKTPYYIHPIWCAMTILTETKLSKQLREDGCLALLYHDLLEDTTEKLPPSLSKRVKHFIKEMTFTQGITQEMQEIWKKEPEVKLLKLYDKVSNLLDSSWMSPELRDKYTQYTKRLLKDVEQNFGQLNIVRIAHTFIKKS